MTKSAFIFPKNENDILNYLYKVPVYRFRDNSDTNDREAGTYMEPSNGASLLLVHSRESRINLKAQPSKKGGVGLLYASGLARNLAL